MAAKPSYRLLLRLWPYLRPYLHWLVIGSALALVVSSAEGSSPGSSSPPSTTSS